MSGDRFLRKLRYLSLCGAVALAGLAAGCNLKGLAHDQLYGSADAAIERPVGPSSDADGSDQDDADSGVAPDSTAPDASDDGPAADLPAGDAAEDAGPDAVAPPDAAPDAPPAPCTPASCPSDQFCDDISGACLPREGTGMISGAIYDACLHISVNAKVGIAGRHACSAAGKGAYYFSGIPLGRLTVAAAAAGYQLFTQEVTIVPGGNTLNIALDRSAPVTCADPAPAAVACSCPEPTCVTP